ncbi:MAG TPA: DUF5049 domain-containing protein [Armatimonadota bacterium]|nr:DUF5049 domain-containing protein [Armatimonadota bacterium]
MKEPIAVPAAVLEGLEAVRQSGDTNMLDRPRVIELAEVMGYDETAVWVRDNRHLYAEGIFAGFRADDMEVA